VAEWTSWDTHTGAIVLPDGTAIPATGTTVEVDAVTVCRVTDGRFTTWRDYNDSGPWMKQLGLVPGT
jgi:limonene-1,2-epoxide hydrolase